jgi:hypothetical protein
MTVSNLVLPTFTTELPISKRLITFRPFVVKEEKLLIMANAGDDISDVMKAIGQIVKECSFGEVDVDRDAMFDVFHLFLQLRGKSIGEVMEYFLICDTCEHKTPATVHVDDFKLRRTPGHTNRIDLGSCQVSMRYPTYKHYSALYETNEPDRVFDVVAGCIESIITSEEMQVQTPERAGEFRSFVDNLTPAQFKKLADFFETMPVLEYVISYICDGTITEGTETKKCGKRVEVAVDGIRNFFE